MTTDRPPDARAINRRVIAQFRAGDEIEGMHRNRLLLLTTTGRRSGTAVTTPLMFHPHGDRVLVIASNIGAPRHPDWYLNLVTEPAVHVERDEGGYPATALTLIGTDREHAWAEITRLYPFFTEHAARTDRLIPVVALTATTSSLDPPARD